MIIVYNQFATYYVCLLLCKRVDVVTFNTGHKYAHASGPARCLVRSSLSLNQANAFAGSSSMRLSLHRGTPQTSVVSRSLDLMSLLSRLRLRHVMFAVSLSQNYF